MVRLPHGFIPGLFLAFLFSGLTRAEETLPRKVAFIVGVNKYDFDFENLRFAERDAEELAKILKDRGFEVVVLTGSGSGQNRATKENLEARLRELLDGDGDGPRKVKKGDLVLVALSGHGLQMEVAEEDTPGRIKDAPVRKKEDAFFCPVDALKNNSKKLVSLSHLLDEVLAPRGSRNFLLVDACRGIADPNKGKGIEGRDMALKGETAVLFSCSRGERSYENANIEHGVFTYTLLQVLRDAAAKNQELSWTGLVDAVETRMATPAFRKLLPDGKVQTPIPTSGQLPRTVLLASRGTAEIDRFMDRVADDLAAYLKNSKADRVVLPRLDGLSVLPAGTQNGFTEKLKDKLETLGIQVSGRADFAFVVKFMIPEEEFKQGRLQLRLIGSVEDQLGKVVHRVQGDGPVTDPKTIAEYLGLTSHFGADNRDEKGQEKLKDAFQSKTIYVSPDERRLYSSKDGLFGVEMRIRDKAQPFREAVEGLAYTGLTKGQECTVLLVNNSDDECAVDVKVDGLNIFHFCDPDYRVKEGERKGQSLHRYYVVSPKSVTEVPGWYKSPTRSLGFKATSFEESAVAKAGIAQDKVGLITATFHASWEADNKRPKDEPKKETKHIIYEKVPVTKEVVVTKQLPGGGNVVEKMTITEYQTVAKEVIAIGFGTEIVTNTQGVKRTIGVPRATIAFRYDRP